MEWFSAFISDIATGIVASLIIIFFVDKIIERNKEKERLEIVRVAIRRLRIPIIWHMTLLINMYKAAVQNKPSTLPTTYKDTFTDVYYKEISFLDFSKDAPVALKMDWFTYLDSNVIMFKQKIEQLVDTYSTFLDTKLLDILVKITESSFLYFIPQIKNIPLIDRQMGFKRAYAMFKGMEEIVGEHIYLVLQLIENYNSYADSPIELDQGIWRDDVAPKWGSSRI